MHLFLKILFFQILFIYLFYTDITLGVILSVHLFYNILYNTNNNFLVHMMHIN